MRVEGYLNHLFEAKKLIIAMECITIIQKWIFVV